MNFSTILFQSDKFTLKLNHLIIIGVLILAFSASMFIRSQPAQYGNHLNEFDPFFNFRATEYIVENGFSEYFQWHDEKSWYPEGRNISATSQIMLHVTAAITYQIFGGDLSLYDDEDMEESYDKIMNDLKYIDLNSNDSLEIYGLKLDSSAAAHLEIIYDYGSIIIDSVSPGPFFQNSND